MTTSRWTPPAHPGGPIVVTPRMADVLTGLHEGLSNKEIGRRLYITEDTVKSHVKQLLASTRCRNRAHVVALTAARPVQVREGRWAA